MNSGFADPQPDAWRLGEPDVHLWLARLDCASHEHADYSAVLSPDEREKANRFRFERDQKRFAAGRGILRHLLAKYLDRPPRELKFSYGSHGKPSLDGNLRFNLAHADDWALFALTLGRDIGVDIERLRPNFATLDIAERFFSRREFEGLASLPEQERCAAFFHCWTRKEAFIKAKGMGVFLGLHTFAVSFAPGEEPRLLHLDGDSSAVERWSIVPLQAPTGYVAAAAIEGKNLAVKCWNWPD